MSTITKREASEQGYQSITTDISTFNEPNILSSIEITMKGVDAVWIQTGALTVQLGRKRKEIKA